jgi:hypothetical protein
MASRGEDELAPSKTEGFKVGEKKTLDEYAKLGMGLHILFSDLLVCSEGLSCVAFAASAAGQITYFQAFGCGSSRLSLNIP